MSGVYIGIDIGGTNMRLGLVDGAGRVLKLERAKTASAEGYGAIIKKLAKGVSALVSYASEEGHTLGGVGIGVPGIVSPQEGVVRFSPNLPGWVDAPLRESVSVFSPVPVFVDNDANAYAMGEATFGAGAGIDSFLCLTLGTGVGGGVILNRRIWRGADGMAGEAGHMTVEPRGPKCHCGNSGCLERYSSATGVVERTLLALSRDRKSTLRDEYDRDPAAITAEAVSRAAEEGDRLARDVFSDAGRYLGIVSAGIINLLNMDSIVIGGGLSAAWELLIGPLEKEISARAFDIPARRCKVQRGALGDNAGILGAASLAAASGAQ